MILKTEKVMGLDGEVKRRHHQLILRQDGSQFKRLTCWYPRPRKVPK